MDWRNFLKEFISCQKTEFIIKAINTRRLSRTVAKCVCQWTLKAAERPFSLGLIIQLKVTKLDPVEGKITFFFLFYFFFSCPTLIFQVHLRWMQYSFVSSTCDLAFLKSEMRLENGEEGKLSPVISLAIFYLGWII